MGIWKNRKSIVYERREIYIKVIKKIIILGMAIIISIIAWKFITKVKFESNQEKIYTKAEIVEDSKAENNSVLEDTEETESSNLDNSGYIPLEKDPNAEDAITVVHITDKLIKNEVKYPVRTDGKKVAYLTFDDGPSTTNTPKVLDILKENGIKATFMIMGKNAELTEQSKGILRRIVKEGQAVGNHTYSHDYNYLYPYVGKLRTINLKNFMADVDKCNEILKNILGKDFITRVLRFPGGYWNWDGRTNIAPIIAEKGYASINWNDLSEDGAGKPNKTAEELLEVSKHYLDLLGKDADSVVFLMHDTYGKEETVKSLQSIIDMFKERGFEFKTIK
jgi:peptidoglycan/xylan/chitin deacetylase (PgdA/CDA1 family)